MPAAVETAKPAAELRRLERVIETKMDTFREVGMAFVRIKEGKLYQVTHNSWQDYLKERWGFSRQHAHKILQAAQAAERIIEASPEEPRPTTEYQVRPLTKLPEEEQLDAWKESVQEAGGEAPSHSQVKKVVERRRPQPERQPELEPVPEEPGELRDGDDGAVNSWLQGIHRMVEQFEAVSRLRPSLDQAKELLRLLPHAGRVLASLKSAADGALLQEALKDDERMLDYLEDFADREGLEVNFREVALSTNIGVLRGEVAEGNAYDRCLAFLRMYGGAK